MQLGQSGTAAAHAGRMYLRLPKYEYRLPAHPPGIEWATTPSRPTVKRSGLCRGVSLLLQWAKFARSPARQAVTAEEEREEVVLRRFGAVNIEGIRLHSGG